MNGELTDFLFRYRWPLLAAAFGVILILLGIVTINKQLPWFEGDKVEILTQESGEIVVEIAGAIQKPGVYKFPAGTRIENLLISAGGLSANADREWVTKFLNRAAKLADGQKVYIRSIGESGGQRIGSQKTGGSESQIIGVSDYQRLVNINTASQAELEALPGIGPVTAQKIIDNRPYSGVEELLTRKILKKSVYEENKDKLSVY